MLLHGEKKSVAFTGFIVPKSEPVKSTGKQ